MPGLRDPLMKDCDKVRNRVVGRGEPDVLKPPTPEEREQLASAGMAWGMGCSIVVSILISVLGGLLIDKAADTTPLFTLIGVGLGLFLAGYQLWELAQLGSKAGQVGPVARRVARVQNRGKNRRTTER
jgi:F0F1-type ATP synthase assembly protein I